VDATRPGGALLPLGWRREAESGLRRAHLIWVARAGLVPESGLAALLARLAGFGAPVLRDRHLPGGLSPARGGPVVPAGELAGRPVVLASGIGNPDAFEEAARRLGWAVRRAYRFRDHHAYGPADAALLAEAAAGAVLVMTAKDAVKLAPLLPAGCDGRVLEPSDRLDEAGLAELDRLLRRAVP
jgi:tetraacyldisaccharide 4'-kinase